MINFKVFRLGDIGKNLVKVIILFVGIILITRFFYIVKKVDLNRYVEDRRKEFSSKTFAELLRENLNEKNEETKRKKENVISSELKFTDGFISENKEGLVEDNAEQGDAEQNNVEQDNSEKVEDVEVNNSEDVPKEVSTSVVLQHNKDDVYNATFSTVQIRNQTSINLTEDMLSPDIGFDKSNIVIFHTHTSESYTPSEEYNYIASGNFRTQDTRCSVVGVGNELANRLQNKGINVIHDTTFHDYPEYNGAYTRSLATVQSILSNTPADLVIDMHRDAIGDSSYGPSVMIGEEKVAQLMFVMGSNEGGLEHPNWLQNLKIAIKIQEKANEMYPGLFKPILLTQYRYNEHVAKGACIIEVGATGNTMEECVGSMKYLAEVIAAVE